MIGDKKRPKFNNWEKSRNYKLIWINLDKAIKIFEKCNPKDSFDRGIHFRDLNFLKQAKKLCEETNFRI